MQPNESIEILCDVINQACRTGEKNELDSRALSAYADGMRYLSVVDKITITHEYGRRVIGYWNDEPAPGGKDDL